VSAIKRVFIACRCLGKKLGEQGLDFILILFGCLFKPSKGVSLGNFCSV